MPRASKRPVVIGERFGRLVVVASATEPTPWGSRRVISCVCDCGKACARKPEILLHGKSTSCGCAAREALRQRARAPEWIASARAALTKHGGAKTPEYVSWRAAHQRCRNKRLKSWPRYGGRGITVCEHWARFENFIEDMGHRPRGTTLERNDNDGNYEPGNCRWATRQERKRHEPVIGRARTATAAVERNEEVQRYGSVGALWGACRQGNSSSSRVLELDEV